MTSKKDLSEQDICTKYITPAIEKSGWDKMTQIREQIFFTKGRIQIKGKIVKRGKGKRADYILYHKSNFPIAVVEEFGARDGYVEAVESLEREIYNLNI